MKEVNCYQCEVCGGLSEIEAVALSCENKHNAVRKADFKYREGSAYPHKIRVEFSNGQVKHYKLEDPSFT